MINALIRKGDQTAILSLPADRFSLQYDLAQIGIRQRLTEIPIHDDEEQEISVKLFADSDIGNSLAVLFNSAHSLDDANLCAHMVENARPELQEEIEQHIVHGQYYSPQAIVADIKAMTDGLIGVTVNYYCPLQIHMTDEEYGDWYEVDAGQDVGTVTLSANDGEPIENDIIPRHAHKRGSGSESVYKGNQDGSLPEYSFHWHGTSDRLYLFEAPIDMLSYISMNKGGWQQHSYAAACGVSDQVLWQMMKDNPNIRSVYLCLDNDEPGQAAAKRISDKLFTHGISHEIVIPSHKDWNDDLIFSEQEEPKRCQTLQLSSL